MKKLMRLSFWVLLMIMMQDVSAQFNIGGVSGGDLYQRFVNPADASGQDRSAGSAILNSALGLKMWVGSPKFSVSVESYANLGMLGLNIEEYKGLGTFSVPVLAKLNFNGLSGLNIEKMRGWYLGGGIQWNKTEFYGLSSAARDAGVERPFFQTYVVELGFGNGTRTKMSEYFIRFGFNPEISASSFSIGANTSYSFPFFKMPNFNIKPEGKDEEEIIKM